MMEIPVCEKCGTVIDEQEGMLCEDCKGEEIHVVIGVFSGVIGDDIYAYRDAGEAGEKEKELRAEYGLPAVKEEREEDYRENEVRHFVVPLNSEVSSG